MVMVVAMSDIYNFDDLTIDVDAFDNYTGRDRWNAVYTIQLGELVESRVFDWERPELDWSAAKYDDEQYSRLCAYFIDRFYYREISIEPFKVWANFLKRKLVYELMPKYKPLYERLSEGIDPFAVEDEYYKNRTIESAYPETLLSENADYITDGRDEEYERIKEGNYADMVEKFTTKYKSVDEMLLDELEILFIGLYTANVNAVW